MHAEETQPLPQARSKAFSAPAATPRAIRPRPIRRHGLLGLAAMAVLGATTLASPAEAQTSLQWLNRQSGGLPPASQALTEAQARESCRLQFGPPSRRESRRGYNEKLRQCIVQRMQGR
jgi:hypothetical protein